MKNIVWINVDCCTHGACIEVAKVGSTNLMKTYRWDSQKDVIKDLKIVEISTKTFVSLASIVKEQTYE